MKIKKRKKFSLKVTLRLSLLGFNLKIKIKILEKKKKIQDKKLIKRRKEKILIWIKN